MILSINIIAPNIYGQSSECEEFIFNWFQLNECISTLSAGGVSSLTATTPIVVNATSGDIAISCPTCLTDTSYKLLTTANPVDGANTFTTSAFTGTKYLTIELYIKGDSAGATGGSAGLRFNSDTGTNYERRFSVNNGADSTTGNADACFFTSSLMDDDNFGYFTGSIVNIASAEKQYTVNGGINVVTDNNAPSSHDTYCTWRNTSNQITTITVFRGGGTWNFDSTTELKVYGHN